MANFLDVIKNWGDFKPSYALQPNELRDGGGRVGVDARGVMLAEGGFRGSGYDEPGMRRIGLKRQEARRLYERDLSLVASALKRAVEGDDYARLAVKHAFSGGGPLREALSISDFPNIFGDIIDRAVLANYRETPYTWNMYAKAATVNDFRPVKRFRIDYGSARLDSVEMGGSYPERKLADNAVAGATGQAAGTANTAGYYSYSLVKKGARMPFFWETFVDDDLNALKDTPARFGRAARRTEEYFVTSLFANNTTFFSNANFANTVVPTGAYTATNPPLSITALAQAFVIMANQRDKDGEPIDVESVVLVVPPALKVTAQNILNADYFWANDQGGTVASNTSAQRLNVANWARNIVKLAVNYYLPIVDATHGQTGWYLFASPEGGRPALEFGRLRGHEQPELFMKMPNSLAIGEGTMGPGTGPMIPGAGAMGNPLEGDFDTDAVHYKVRHVIGGTTIDPIMAVYSNGSGS